MGISNAEFFLTLFYFIFVVVNHSHTCLIWGRLPGVEQTLGTVTCDPQEFFPYTKPSLPTVDFALYSTGWNQFSFSQLIFEVILVSCFLQLKRLCVPGRPGQFVCYGLIFIESSRLRVLLLTGGQTVRAACLQRHPLPVCPFLFAGGFITIYWTEEL